MLDLYQMLLLILFLVVIAAAIPQISDRFKSRSRDRRKETLSESRVNCRVTNAYDNAKYRVMSTLDQEDDFFDWDGETIEWPRTQKTFLNCHPDDFKFDMKRYMQTGKGDIRFFPRNVIDVSSTPVSRDISQGHTNDELKMMLDQSNKDKTELEGENSTLKANREKDVSSRIEDARDIIASKSYHPGS